MFSSRLGLSKSIRAASGISAAAKGSSVSKENVSWLKYIDGSMLKIPERRDLALILNEGDLTLSPFENAIREILRLVISHGLSLILKI